MPITRRPIPVLPSVPRAESIAPDISRSYSTGRQKFSRAFAGSAMELTISTGDHFPPNLQATLFTTLNTTRPDELLEIPFVRRDAKTLTSEIIPQRPGFFSFWTRFSLDGGATWLSDPVPDAWVLVDPPHVDDLRMYTLIPNVSGTLPEWSEALVQIKQMGFNAVHLLPLTTLDTSLSPYSARDLFDIDLSYLALGTPPPPGLDQLEQFIAVAKTLELRLCFDLVLNHVGTDSHIAKKAPEWIMPDPASPDGLRRARYWSDKGWLPWNDLVLINYEHPSQKIRADIQAYMTEYALFWANYASQTGGFVRFDNLHSSDKAFVDSLSQTLRAQYPDVGIIAEYFTDSATMIQTIPTWNLSLILATPWDSRFVPQLRDYLKYLHSISEHVRFFMPITSHDSGSPAQEFGSVQSTIPRYIAAALLGTGATGITQGVEWGLKEKINFIGKSPKLTPIGRPLFADFLAKVNHIVADYPAFRTGGNCTFVDKDHHAIIAAFRKDAHGAGILIICNFDILNEHAFETDLTHQLNTTGPVHCVDLLTGTERTFPSPCICLILPACGAHVFSFSPTK
jgi:hypothetical protein